jgi:uncharacterized protein (DUF3820 family)
MKINRYDEYKNTKIRFGKYIGKTLNNIPTDYIKWVIINHADQGIQTMFAVELLRRERNQKKEK